MHMMKRQILTLLIVLTASAACATSMDEPAKKPERPGITKVEPGTKIQDIKSDDFNMQKVWIEGDVLKINVRYGGGCEKHDFKLYWNGIVARSYPGQTTIHLKHDANGDSCEALISETLEFDLTAITKPMVITIKSDHGGSFRVTYGESKLK